MTVATRSTSTQRPVEIERVLVSTQHSDGIGSEDLIKPDIVERVLHPILPTASLRREASPRTRDFVHQPDRQVRDRRADGRHGLTGRKIIVDTYGGAARHGGGAFSGKDPTKVDRSAAYAARYMAKNLVAAGLADRIEVNSPTRSASPRFRSPCRVRHGAHPRHPHRGARERALRSQARAIIRDLNLQRPIYGRPPLTGTSAATTTTSRGSAPTRPSAPELPRAPGQEARV